MKTYCRAVLMLVGLVFLPGAVQGQIRNPDPPVVTAGPRAKALSYNATLETQEAAYDCSIDLPASWSYLILEYEWSGLNFRGNDNTPTPTGYAETTGVYGVSCRMLIVADWPGAIPFYTEWFQAEKPVYAVGGPLTYEVPNASTYTHDGKQSTKPWYLHAFYFNPFEGVPSNAQSPQKGMVQIALPQPAGVSFEWTITGGGVLNGDAEFLETATFAQVAAISPTSEGAIKVRVKFTIVVDSVSYGPFDDDSEQTPPPAPYVNNAYYSFTGHTPTDVEVVDSSVNQSIQTGPYTHTVSFGQKAYDQHGVVMPGLWIQERFPYFDDEVLYWGVEALYEVGTTTNNWTTGGNNVDVLDTPVSSIDGLFADLIGVVAWPEVHDSSFWQTPILELTQKYYGATHDPTIGGYGIFIGTFKNRMWTDYSQHEKQ